MELLIFCDYGLASLFSQLLLLYSSLMCLHGTQLSSGCQGVPVAVDFVIAEGHLATNDV